MQKFILSSLHKEITTDANEIRLDDKINISQIFVKETPYDIRGNSIISSFYLRNLVYEKEIEKEKEIINLFWNDVKQHLLKIVPKIEEWFKDNMDIKIELKGE